MVGGGMQANTETSRSSARARAATTMSILIFSFKRLISTSAHLTCVNFLLSILKLRQSIEFGFISNNEKFYGERKRLASDWCTHYWPPRIIFLCFLGFCHASKWKEFSFISNKCGDPDDDNHYIAMYYLLRKESTIVMVWIWTNTFHILDDIRSYN